MKSWEAMNFVKEVFGRMSVEVNQLKPSIAFSVFSRHISLIQIIK